MTWTTSQVPRHRSMSEPEPAPDYEHEPTPEDKHDSDDIEDIVPVPYQRPDDAAVPLIRFLKEPGRKGPRERPQCIHMKQYLHG
eukprot:COSAG02_NODE_143_length_34133_cov_272.981282_20_plen_84_part_00